MTDILKWLEQASEPCGNDACIGEWAAVHGRALLAEVERLRVDAELGRLVREGLPAIAQHSGDEAWLRYDHLDQMWGAGYTGYAEFSSCDPDNALETVLGDVLRKA